MTDWQPMDTAPKDRNVLLTSSIDEMIEHMVQRFLQWRLPDDFSPDCGVSFEPIHSKGTQYEGRLEPTGTNLLDYTQAKQMVRHMVEGSNLGWRTPSAKEVGRAMRERRWHLRQSIRQAAAGCGISPTTYLRVERGSDPDLATLRKIDTWLKTPLDLPQPPEGEAMPLPNPPTKEGE